jgi:hypothetical protein
MNMDYERNKVRYKLTYTQDKELKSVLKFQDNKIISINGTMKKDFLDSKWKFFGEIGSDHKKEF